ncbi:MAG: hypothetical protein E4H40_01250, partial [Candidatus Brocadiia bacterium]
MIKFDQTRKRLTTLLCFCVVSTSVFAQTPAKDNTSGLYVSKATWQETLLAAHANIARQQSQQGESALSSSIPQESAIAVIEGIVRDFPQESRWFQKRRIHNEYVEWLIDPNSTKVERDILGELLRSIDFGAEGLREKFDILCRTKASVRDRGWLDLYVESMNFSWQLSCFKDMNPSALRSAILYLAGAYPGYKAIASEYLQRLDDYELKLSEANRVSAEEKKLEQKKLLAISEEFLSLRKEALIGNHPLIDFDKIVFVRRYTYQSSHYYT